MASAKKFRKTKKQNSQLLTSTTMVTATPTNNTTEIYQYRQTEFDIVQKGIHVYILDNKDQRIGVLAAVSNDLNPDIVYIGWSLCNFSLGDRFDPKRGVEIAYERSRKCSASGIPMSIFDRYQAFKFRCQKYFKNKQAFV